MPVFGVAGPLENLRSSPALLALKLRKFDLPSTKPKLIKPDRNGKPVTQWRLEVDNRAFGTDVHRNLIFKKTINIYGYHLDLSYYLVSTK